MFSTFEGLIWLLKKFYLSISTYLFVSIFYVDCSKIPSKSYCQKEQSSKIKIMRLVLFSVFVQCVRKEGSVANSTEGPVARKKIIRLWPGFNPKVFPTLLRTYKHIIGITVLQSNVLYFLNTFSMSFFVSFVQYVLVTCFPMLVPAPGPCW